MADPLLDRPPGAVPLDRETLIAEIRLPIDLQLHPNPGHLRWHHSEVFKGRV